MAGQNWSARSNAMSLEEMIKIPQMAVEEHNKIEEGIASLQAQADKWEVLANSAQDKAQYQQYKAYADELKKQSDKLAMYGINANSRRDLYKLNQDYQKKINPINQAFDYRAKMAEEQRKNNKNGKMIYDVDFSKVSLQDIMNNPNLSYRKIDLEDAQKEGQLAGATASKRNVLSPEEKLVMNGQFYDMVTKQGYTEDQAAEFLANPQNNPALAAYVDQTFNSYDTSTFSDEQKKQLRKSITTGLVQGLTYDERHQLQGNGEYMTAYQKEMMAYRRAEEQRKAELQEKSMMEAGLRKTYLGSNNDGTIQYWYEPPKKGAMSGQIWQYKVTPDGKTTKTSPVEGGGIFNWNNDIFDPSTGKIQYGARRKTESVNAIDPILGIEPGEAKVTGTNLNIAGKAFNTSLSRGLDTDKGGHSIEEILTPGNYNTDTNTLETGIYEATIHIGKDLEPSQKAAIRKYIEKEKLEYPKTAAGDIDWNNIVVVLDKDWGTKNHWKILAKDVFMSKAINAGFTTAQIANMIGVSNMIINENIPAQSENATTTNTMSQDAL